MEFFFAFQYVYRVSTEAFNFGKLCVMHITSPTVRCTIQFGILGNCSLCADNRKEPCF
jgi:hypothetical protein